MSTDLYVQICGGMNNITRVLAPENKLIFAIADSAKIVQSSDRIEVAHVLGEYQVSFSRPKIFTAEDLLVLGREISNQQREQLAPFSVPVECEHRPDWHISPPQGLLNDPNGFIFHNGEYHMFYQWSPYSCTHKDKYWAHLTSKDLVNWHWQPVALTPSDWFDSHGVFSGHAVSDGQELMLFYTGNTRIGQQRDRHTTQCVATSQDGINFTKLGPVIPCPPAGVTEHIRDPKVFKHGGEWKMLLGAQTEELKGRLAVYRSSDLKEWEFEAIYGDEMGDLGYMWECPDFFELDGQSFAVVGPQGIESFSKHNTIPHHNGIAKLEWGSDSGLTLSDFEHLDFGFDFYAPQTMLTPDGRRVMCGWMGLPDEIDQPSADNGWVHQLTTMREICFEDGKLKQWPISELEQLVLSSDQIELGSQSVDIQSKQFDLTVELEWGESLHLFESKNHKVVLSADVQTKSLILDRSSTLNRAKDVIRELPLDSERISLRILADTSSVEVFVNSGEAVMTSRVFTEPTATGISLHGGKKSAQLKRLKPASEPFMQMD